MPIRPQPLPIQFSGGLETKADGKGVPTTKLLDLQNATFTKETTLSKRNGYEALSTLIDETSASYGTPDGIAARGSELVAFANGRAYSHRPSVGCWSDVGGVSSVIASARPIARTGTQQVIPDVAVRNGVMAVAWEDSRGGVWCSVLEDNTGRVLLTDTQLDAAGRNPRCIDCGEVLLVMWARPASNRIYVAVVNPAAPTTVPTPVILVDDLSATNPSFDAMACGGATYPDIRPGVIAWADALGGLRVGYLHSSGVLGGPSTGLPTVATFTEVVEGPVAVAADTYTNQGGFAVLWCGGVTVDSLRGDWLDFELATVRGSFKLGTGVGVYARVTCAIGANVDGDRYVFWAAEEVGARTDRNAIDSGYFSSNAPDWDLISSRLHGHVLVTRAFFDSANTTSGDVYVNVAHAAQFFPYIATVRLSGGAFGGESTVCVARLLPGETLGAHFRRTGPTTQAPIKHLSSVIPTLTSDDETVSRVHRMPLSFRIQLDSEDGDQFSETGVRLFELDFDNLDAYRSVEFGRGLYLAGALPQHYDGNRFVEADYNTAPDYGYDTNGDAVPMSNAFSQGGASGLANGTYLYKFWYEDVDDQGELHQGPASKGIAFEVTGGPREVSIAIPTYRLTNKKNVRICVARSEANAESEGGEELIPLYRVTSTDPGATGNNGFLLNDPTVDTVTFVDALADADMLKREPLYTNGGIRSNDPAPWAGDVIAGGKSRLFWTDPSDPDVVRYSKTRKDDIALEAPSSFSLRVDPYGGRIRAIGILDDKVIVFKDTAVYAFTGPGPLDDPDVDPNANAFSPAQLVTSDVGCDSPASVGQTPVGLIFKSAKGIVLLGRDMQVARVGSPVDGYNDQRVMRTTLLPDRPQILMLTDEGRTLLYDYERGQWSTYTNHEGYDACVIDGVYHYLRTDGRVFAETPGVYRDDNLHIPMLVETAWVKMAGYLQGYQRVLWAYFLGRHISPHSLVVRFRLDYDDNWRGPFTLDVDANVDPAAYGAGPYGAGAYGGDIASTSRYQRAIHMNQACQAIQFRIEDVEQTDDFGASFELSELLLIGGVLDTSFKPGPARRSV